jgi:predicted NBD/HSP70 family sugar kinase
VVRLGATARDLRRTNRSAVIRELLLSGELTRQVLADRTGLSLATVGLVITALLRERLVVEVGTQDSDGGRPRTLLRMSAHHGIVIGVDVGEDAIRVEAFDLRWDTKGIVVLPRDRAHGDPGTAVELIEQGVTRLFAETGVDSGKLLGVGVGVSGIVERGPDGLVHAVAFGWDGVPVGRLLRERLGVPVHVDNGAKTMGQAEMWFGAGQGARDAVVALLGTGVGAAVFTGGRLYRGSQSSAGEWGHTPIVVGGRACRCGSRGCLEAYIGGSALLDRWVEIGGTHEADAASDEARLRAILGSSPGDPHRGRLIDEWCDHLGAGLGTLINLFNPERIVLAGWVGLLIDPVILEGIKVRAAVYALRQPFDSVEITMGRLGIDAVALGAATLVMNDLLAVDAEPPEAVPGIRSGRSPEVAAGVA